MYASSTGWSPGFGVGKRMQEQNEIEQIGCGLEIERLQRLIRFVIVSLILFCHLKKLLILEIPRTQTLAQGINWQQI